MLVQQVIKCPLCDSTQNESFYGDDNRILRCSHCNLGFLNPDLWIRNLDAYYEQNPAYAENSLDQDKIQLMKAAAKDLVVIMNRFVASVSGNKLLDIGSNYGIFLEHANSCGYLTKGLELNKTLVEKSQKRGLNVTCGGALDITDRDSYDTITMIHVLEHVSDVRSALEKMHIALKKNGLLFLEVHNADSYISKKHKSSWKYVSLEHLYYFTPKTLTDLLREQGFDILHVQSRNHYLESFSIKYLFQYIWATEQHRDRFFKKNIDLKTKKEYFKQNVSFVRKVIRRVLICIIKMLKREDLMLIVAKKI